MTVGKKLKLKRVYLDLTMESVAKDMGTSKQVICNIERGKSTNAMELFYEHTLNGYLKERGKTLIIED